MRKVSDVQKVCAVRMRLLRKQFTAIHLISLVDFAPRMMKTLSTFTWSYQMYVAAIIQFNNEDIKGSRILKIFIIILHFYNFTIYIYNFTYFYE